MKHKILILTGTRASGKSSVAKKIIGTDNNFFIVRATTTRTIRSDESVDDYEFIDKEEFKQIKESELFIKTEYDNNYYGIRKESLKSTLSESKIPILIVSPNTVKSIKTKLQNEYSIMSVFLDNDDEVLDNRLKKRESKEINSENDSLRKRDREYIEDSDYYLFNNNLESTVDLVVLLIDYQNIGGVLTEKLIRLFIECGTLVKNAIETNIKGASYDIRLGDEYWQEGKRKKLLDGNVFVKIKPYDFVVATSEETFALPKDIVGRFDLSVGVFLKGVILSNGPQIDPGFNGRLFCLLFNISSEDVQLKRHSHYASIEFNKLLAVTTPYRDKYQDKKEITGALSIELSGGLATRLEKMEKKVNSLDRAKITAWTTMVIGILTIIGIVIKYIIY